MQYAIVYSSRTGNTKALAESIQAALPAGDCLYAGPLPYPPGLVLPPLVFAGFWTFRGGCDDAFAAFLQTLGEQSVFLFGTAGYGCSPEYSEKIMENVKKYLPTGSHLRGSYLCQGEMPPSTKERYEALLKEKPADENLQKMLQNYEAALGHPNAADKASLLDTLRPLVQRTV